MPPDLSPDLSLDLSLGLSRDVCPTDLPGRSSSDLARNLSRSVPWTSEWRCWISSTRVRSPRRRRHSVTAAVLLKSRAIFPGHCGKRMNRLSCMQSRMEGSGNTCAIVAGTTQTYHKDNFHKGGSVRHGSFAARAVDLKLTPPRSQLRVGDCYAPKHLRCVCCAASAARGRP